MSLIGKIFPEDYKPTEYQRQLHESTDKYNALLLDTGEGKTTAGIYDTVSIALTYLGAVCGFISKEYRDLVENILFVKNEFSNYIYTSSWEMIKFNNGSIIIFDMHGDATTLRWVSYNYIFIDDGNFLENSNCITYLLSRLRYINEYPHKFIVAGNISSNPFFESYFNTINSPVEYRLIWLY